MKIIACYTLVAFSFFANAAFAQVTKNVPIEVGESAEIVINSGGDKVVVTCGGQGQNHQAIKCSCYFGFQYVGDAVGNSSSDFGQLCKSATGFNSEPKGCQAL